MQLDSDQPFSPGGRQSRRITDNDDTSIDRQSGQLTWKAQNKHFVVEDDHCGVHLIKNALGGSRRGLFESVMTLRPPISPSVRGDLSVVVTFFDDQQRDNTLDTAQGAVPMIYIGSQEPSDGR
jgi:pyruvate dehydrogenase phosphatase